MLTRPMFSVHHKVPAYCPFTDALIGTDTLRVYPARSEREASAIARRRYRELFDCCDDSFDIHRYDDQTGRWVRLFASPSLEVLDEGDYIPF